VTANTVCFLHMYGMDKIMHKKDRRSRKRGTQAT
jgi:hypothetical protein